MFDEINIEYLEVFFEEKFCIVFEEKLKVIFEDILNFILDNKFKEVYLSMFKLVEFIEEVKKFVFFVSS